MTLFTAIGTVIAVITDPRDLSFWPMGLFGSISMWNFLKRDQVSHDEGTNVCLADPNTEWDTSQWDKMVSPRTELEQQDSARWVPWLEKRLRKRDTYNRIQRILSNTVLFALFVSIAVNLRLRNQFSNLLLLDVALFNVAEFIASRTFLRSTIRCDTWALARALCRGERLDLAVDLMDYPQEIVAIAATAAVIGILEARPSTQITPQSCRKLLYRVRREELNRAANSMDRTILTDSDITPQRLQKAILRVAPILFSPAEIDKSIVPDLLWILTLDPETPAARSLGTTARNLLPVLEQSSENGKLKATLLRSSDQISPAQLLRPVDEQQQLATELLRMP